MVVRKIKIPDFKKPSKKRLFFIGLIIFAIVWKLFLKNLLWPFLFAEPTHTDFSDKPLSMDIRQLDGIAPQYFRFGNYKIEISIRAEAQLTARVVYIDVYDDWFYFGFKGVIGRMKDVYDAVSPLDLSVMTGKTAENGNWQKFTIKHEYRSLFWQYQTENMPYHQYGEINNLHIIPSSFAIRRGFDLLKKGQIVRLKGYLVDWRDMGEFAAYPYHSALEIGQVADFKLGGQISGLCYYFFVTELEFNNNLYR